MEAFVIRNKKMQLLEFSLSCSFRFLFAFYARFFVMLPFSYLGQYAGLSARTLKSSKGAI